jgi:SAM-dependent methyltransferase
MALKIAAPALGDSMTLAPFIQEILVCPACNGGLARESAAFHCPGCDIRYPAKAGQVDLRLRRPVKRTVDYLIGQNGAESAPPPVQPLTLSEAQRSKAEKYRTMRLRNPLLMALLPPAPSGDALALDLGCGPSAHRAAIEAEGYQYVGIDYAHPASTLLGDAHALPFPNGVFDAVVSMAVLEHLQYPHVAFHDLARVLKPGGTVLGTVSFLEPFHDESYYHHSHLGVYTTLAHAGLRIAAIAPGWPVTQALQRMDGLARPARFLLKAVDGVNRIMQTVHPMPQRVLKSSASFYFLAYKQAPGEDTPAPRP